MTLKCWADAVTNWETVNTQCVSGHAIECAVRSLARSQVHWHVSAAYTHSINILADVPVHFQSSQISS